MNIIPVIQRCARVVLLGFSVSVSLCAPRESEAAEIYVSVAGSAPADGSLAKPCGSLPDAVNAVRVRRKAGETNPVVIYLREGRHSLNQTLILGLADGNPARSSSANPVQPGAGETREPAYLTIAAYPGEHPVLSAGMPVTGWRRLESAPPELPAKAAGKVWVADLPAEVQRFSTLYDGKGRLNRARAAGFVPTKMGDRRTLYFPAGALKSWDNLTDVELHVRPGRAWVINMLPLASVDVAAGVAKTGVSATYEMGVLPPYLLKLMEKPSSVWVENILEALDEPGEWVVNTKTRKIYLWPSDPAPDGSPRGILAPTTSELIRVEGMIDYDGPADKPVRGIAFSGLTFSHADRWASTTDENRLGWGMQHDWDMFDRPTAMLRFRGTEACRVSGCRFVDSGGSGLRMDLHAQRNRVENCECAHLGEAGILLAGYGPGTKDVNHHNDITNNLIHHFSEITWHSPGIWAWQSGHNRIVHNELHHSGYSAVLLTTRVMPNQSLTGEGGMTVRRNEIEVEDGNRTRDGYESWRAREKYNHSRRNLVEYNDISHCVQLLSDGNAIYVSGTGTGNIVRYNFIHDNVSHVFPAAIRCDDDQNETLIYGNVLYNNAGFSAGIASKGVNDIINNFIVAPAVAPRGGYISFEWASVIGSKAQRNIIISHPEGGSAYAERLRGGSRIGGGGPKLVETDMDSNLYYHPTDPHWVDEHLLKMRAVGKEEASLFGDPLFTDPADGDFSFRPGSPALKLGIEPLDVSKMGRLDAISTLTGSALAQNAERVAADSDRDSLSRATLIMRKIDTNGDGTFEKNEDASAWRRYRQLDANQDGALSIDELRKEQIAYLESGGERELDIAYKQTPQGKLLLDLYYPTATSGNKRSSRSPVIIYTHGGGWAAGSKQGIANGSFAPLFQNLLDHGFAVASVNYRLCRPGTSVTMRDCVTDSKDAVRYLAKHSDTLNLDRTRFFAMGDSAGGQIAQMLLLSSPETLPGDKDLAAVPYKMLAGVSWYGPCDFEKIDLFNHDDRAGFRDRFGPRILGPNLDPASKLERYREMSPVNYLSKDSPPLLMIQGNQDTTIPVKHAYYMKQNADAVKAPVEIMIIKNAGHNWRKVDAEIDPSREAIIERTVQFFVDHL